MRKINVLEFVSLDGVIQAPGGPEEDTSGGFAYGGWTAPHSDAVSGTAMMKQMKMPCDLLLGRKTFDNFASFWPQHNDIWPGVNTATKYVASNTLTSHEWQPSVFLNGDIAEKIAKIKQQAGPDLHVYGSANLVQTLLKHDLCRHKHQPHRIFSDNIALHQSQWRTRRGEVWLAAAQHEGTQIKTIFVDQTKLSKTPRKLRPGNVDLA